MRRGGVIAALALAFVLPAAAHADFPYAGSGDAHDPTTFHLTPPTAPNDFDANEFKGLATPETGNAPVNNQQDELCGIRGDSTYDLATTQPTGTCATGDVHTAWNVTTGRPDVLISVLDSGIEWNNHDAMSDLRFKVHLNKGELPEPEVGATEHGQTGADCSTYTAGGYDVNGDGVFNLRDYACDPRMAAALADSRRHGPPGYLTPEDLIIAFSDHTDADHNGYVDDIAGWDFVDDKNDPYDDVQYGHGTGEARDSNAEANNGNSLGTCPNCMVMPLRVGESFVADANRFAEATLYATDNGTSIVQEALGTLNAPKFARQAIDYAYNHGVTVIASAADEAAEHHNQPGALPHTIVVNSVRNYDSTFTSIPKSYLQFNGCTNFSTRVTLAVPSTSCSSEATGRSSGIAGLIYSAAMNAHLTSSDCTRVDGSPCAITPTEVRELMASGHIGGSQPADEGAGGQADDVHFADSGTDCSTDIPTCTDPNSNTVFNADQNGGLVAPLPDSRRYHARKGFDEFYGYGRLNAYNAVHAASAGTIPPEADITSPDWFEQVDPAKPSFAIEGFVNARGSDYTCKVEIAPGGQPDNTTDFHTVDSDWCNGKHHSSAHSGVLGQVTTSSLKALYPAGNPSSFDGNENGGLPAQTSNGRPNTMPYAFTVRVVVTTVGTSPQMTGEDRRQAFLHRDKDMLPNFPIQMKSDGDSSPLLIDLDGDNRNELVVANSDGVIHAYRPDGSELPGWPVHTRALPDHSGARAYSASDGVGTGHYNAVLGALAAGDLFGDGRLEVVADDNGGNVYAWDQSGHEVFHAEANPDFSGAPLSEFDTVRKGPRDRTEHGFLASPVLADLDGGGLDIIAAGDDRHLYAWHADGSSVHGFPLIVVDPDKVASIDPATHHVTFNSNAAANPGTDEDQGKIIDTPAVAKVDGADKPPTIFLGTNEEYAVNTGDEGEINAGLTSASVTAIGATGVLAFANGRAYAIKNDGDVSGHPFRDGWPKKVGIIDRGLLPDVGEGVNGSPVVGPVTCPSGGQGMKIALAPDAGPGYVFNPDGSSCYGNSGGKDNTLETDFAAAAPEKYDTPTFPAVGYPAFGTLETGAPPDIFMPTTGLIRALDVVAPEYQGGQDFVGGWNASTGQFRPGYPSPVNDLQFLAGQAIGDVADIPGTQQVLGGTASLDLQALNSAGAPASSAWPKMTADWTVATPTLGSFGTLDSDASAHKDVVSITRAGELSVYDTPAAACSPSSSPRFHHDNANSGDYTRDAVLPGTPYDATVSGNSITFKAPGDDLMCGQAKGYQLVASGHSLGPHDLDGTPITATQWDPGSAHTVTVDGGGRYLALRFVDDQGNVGRTFIFDRANGAGGGGGPTGHGGTAAGPTGNAAACSDRTKPHSSKLHRHANRQGIRVRGHARDRGCAGVRREVVSVAKVRGRSCRFLTKSGHLTRGRSCRKPVLLRARGGRSWTFTLHHRLPKGHYRLVARAVDKLGNRELPGRTNRMRFRIR